jgi:thioester reductase-like protein
LEAIEQSHPQLQGRVNLAEGDITKPDLGLTDASRIKREMREIFHLAAVYDLRVPRDLGLRVNVDGTQNVIAFAEAAPKLSRLQYVSTCYVSGRHRGAFSEQDLDKGQSFNNFYEETKFLAEVEVRAGIEAGLPGTIYRPTIVVGDSRTGVVQKYDGPYYVIRWLLRQPMLAVLPMVGDPSATRVNLVPQNFVVDAIAYLSGLEQSVGKTYQLADPEPLTVNELVNVLARATCRNVVRVPCPLRLAKFAIDRIPGVYRLMQIPSPAIDYFVHPTLYSCNSTLADLGASGLGVPPFPTYVDRLVEYVRRHPEIGSHAMV